MNEFRAAVSTATAMRPLMGETECGDIAAVIQHELDVLVILSDGLGHGPRAAEAAQALVDIARTHADRPLDEIFSLAHRSLLRSRGCVASLARFRGGRDGEFEYAGIGNVTAQIFTPDGTRIAQPLGLPGIVGSSFRAPRVEVVEFPVGSVLVLHTDGVRPLSSFREEIPFPDVASTDLPELCQTILRDFGKSSDDAACCVVLALSPSNAPVSQAVPVPSIVSAPDAESVGTIFVRSKGEVADAAEEAQRVGMRYGLSLKKQWDFRLAVVDVATAAFERFGACTVRFRFTPEKSSVTSDIRAECQKDAAGQVQGMQEQVRGVAKLVDAFHVDSAGDTVFVRIGKRI